MLRKSSRKILWVFVLFPLIGVWLGFAAWASLKGDRELSKALTVIVIIMGMASPALLIGMKIDERFDRLEELLKKLSRKDECEESETDNTQKDK